MRPPLIEIEWEDSIGDGAWHSPADTAEYVKRTVHEDHSVCYTAGYVVHRSRKAIVLAQSLHGDNRGGLWTIPRRMVKSIRKLT